MISLQKLRYIPGVLRTYRNPTLRLADYLGRIPLGQLLRVDLRNRLTMQIRAGTSDFGVLDDIFLRGVYERALRGIGPGDVVADVGAQCGGFAVAAAARGAKVICFEPLGENCDLLGRNAELNGFAERVVIHQVAVAGTRGSRHLYGPRGNTGGMTLFPSFHPEWARQPVNQVQVECIVLHDVVELRGPEGYACLKMDCEGAEFEIFEQADADDLRAIHAIIMECHPIGDPRTIAARLEDFGFAVLVCGDPAVLYAVQARG